MKKGASLIELVISIVVMGITLMSLPLVLAQIQKGDEYAIQQEVINAVKAKVGSVLTHYWDGKTFDANSSLSYILDTGGDSELKRKNSSSLYRMGSNSRRFFDLNLSDPLNSTTPPSGAGGMHTQAGTSSFETTASATNAEYIFTISLDTTVNYVSDAADYSGSSIDGFILSPTTSAQSNLKAINVTATINGQTTTLHAFSANIGEAIIRTRTYK